MKTTINSCAACDTNNRYEQTHHIPIVGMVCGECFEKLSEPMLMEGVISQQSLREMAESYSAELSRRSERVRELARILCGVAE